MRFMLAALCTMAVLPWLPSPAAAQALSIWVRTYPERTQPACTWIVAEWSDGSFSASAWGCELGQVAIRADGARASHGYPQLAANGCTEYVSLWSDSSYSWIPFSCPWATAYFKSQSRGMQPFVAGGTTLPPVVPVVPVVPSVPAAPVLPTATQPAPVTPNQPVATPTSTATIPINHAGVAPATRTTCPPNYPIKGNQSSGLYHSPNGKSYNITNPEKCFASAADAQAAGFKPAPE